MIVYRDRYSCGTVRFPCNMMVIYRRKPAFLPGTSKTSGRLASRYQGFRSRFIARALRTDPDAPRRSGVTRVCVGGIVRWHSLSHLPWVNRLERQVPGVALAIQFLKVCNEANLGAVCIGDLFTVELANGGSIAGCEISMDSVPILGGLAGFARITSCDLLQSFRCRKNKDTQESVTGFRGISPILALPQGRTDQPEYHAGIKSKLARRSPERNTVSPHFRNDVSRPSPSVLKLLGHCEELFYGSRDGALVLWKSSRSVLRACTFWAMYALSVAFPTADSVSHRFFPSV
jgi:hypothetical protein